MIGDDYHFDPRDGDCPLCDIIAAVLLALLLGSLAYVALALPELPPLPSDGVRHREYHASPRED